MIEKPPKYQTDELGKLMFDKPGDESLISLINKINDKYEYWDTVKYKPLPNGCSSSRELWLRTKASRVLTTVYPWQKYGLLFGLTNKMQRLCHEFDLNFGGTWEGRSMIPSESRERYLVSSLMEEAIYSSMMEGAATTRKVAKEMLRRKITPKDKSQQMIHNNYQTIQFIVENKYNMLTPELVMHIHRLMTEKTLVNPDDAGRLRTNNNVVVENGITHEVVHVPPPYQVLPIFINDLCDYFNETDAKVFIHPIIRGIIIHYMMAYMHPFVDGNGRTARALFYWYMLKEKYWLTEYMSISRVIANSKKSYEKAFQYVAADDNDLGYFITYNLRVLDQAFKQLQDYIKRKQEERVAANIFLQIGDINERQAQILKMFIDNPKEVITVRSLQDKFMISPTTAKTDIIGLLKKGLLTEISFNKVKRGYIKGEKFDDLINELKI
jgi:Fic family protein